MSRQMVLVFLLMILIITSQFEWNQQLVPETEATPSLAEKQQRVSNREEYVKEKLKMVIPPPVRPERITKFPKTYVLKMHFTNKYVNAQVIHSSTATVADSASSQEVVLREVMEHKPDVAAAAKIGKKLGDRLLLKEIPVVSVFLKREQKYHGKVKAVINTLRDSGVKLLWCKLISVLDLA